MTKKEMPEFILFEVITEHRKYTLESHFYEINDGVLSLKIYKDNRCSEYNGILFASFRSWESITQIEDKSASLPPVAT